ncbi:hypothetical protein J6590_033170 [Homalodisca vitripennis]|nr:hypothetical protein J6590_033170 [Homalodisca vitripennis]
MKESSESPKPSRWFSRDNYKVAIWCTETGPRAVLLLLPVVLRTGYRVDWLHTRILVSPYPDKYLTPTTLGLLDVNLRL